MTACRRAMPRRVRPARAFTSGPDMRLLFASGLLVALLGIGILAWATHLALRNGAATCGSVCNTVPAGSR